MAVDRSPELRSTTASTTPLKPPTDAPERDLALLALRVFDDHPYGILILWRDATVVAQNEAARRLLGPLGAKLDRPGARMPHDLLRTGGEHGTTGLELIEAALERDGPLPEVRVDLPEGGAAEAAWMIVSRIGGPQGRVLVELRPGLRNDRRRRTEPYWAYGPALRISTLGRTRVVCGETVISGRWLANRTGQVLKYLATVRHRAVSADELAEHLWPNAGTRSVQGVRYFIHDLRERLEPDRAPRAESPFVQYSEGGYALDAARVQVDVDEFERAVVAGRAAWAAGNQIAAARWYKEANALYGGDFLADEPYAEWALTERDRLRTLAAEALRMLIASARDDGDLEEAATHLDRLAVLEPFDVDVHRELISVCLQRRRRTEALRRYMSLRHRLLGTFGEELDFTLADLTPAPDSAPVTPVPVARSGRRSPRLPAGMRASA